MARRSVISFTASCALAASKAEMSCLSTISFAAPAWRDASLYWERAWATTPAWVRRWVSRLILSETSCASASVSWRWAWRQLDLDVGIAELHEHRLGGDLGAGLHQLLLDATGGDGGDPADLLGHEGAGCANLAQHGAGLDGVDGQRGALDASGGASLRRLMPAVVRTTKQERAAERGTGGGD